MGLAGCRNQRFFEENLVNQAVNVSANKSALVNGRSGVKVREKLGLIEERSAFEVGVQLESGVFFCARANGVQGTYSGVKLRRSIDLVSISPFLRRYSRIIPGGWYRSRNLLSFIVYLLV